MDLIDMDSIHAIMEKYMCSVELAEKIIRSFELNGNTAELKNIFDETSRERSA